MNKKNICSVFLGIVMSLLVFNDSLAGETSYIDESRIRRYIGELRDRKTAIQARINLATAGSKAVPCLVDAAVDADEKSSVRVMAINILKQIKDPSAAERLIPLLKDEDVKIRRVTAKTLGALKDKKATEMLNEALLNDYDPQVRFFAVRSLEQIGDPRVLDTYILLLKDNDARIRLFSVMALGKIKSTKAVGALSKLTNDIDANIRLALAKTLGKTGDTSCIEPLAVLLSDPHPNVRRHAIEAISYIKNPRSTEALMNIANKSGDKNMRYFAVLGLERLGDKKTEGLLINLLNDESMKVRVASASALGVVNTEKVKTALKTVLDDESSKVRNAARRSLEELEAK
ncbi:MAG: HEAT repeat domain-containing protein [Candidatus Omnitrophica bacterium]|nr:HEAT repeat domain-containing protein [Candidatus Omnitrophota bacterium]